jgi:TIR domain
MPTFDAALLYAGRDYSLVEGIAEWLRSRGAQIWTDKELRNDRPFTLERLRSVLQDSRCVVPLISRSALESRWVQVELDLAFELNMQVIPCLIGEPGETDNLLSDDRLDRRLRSLEFMDLRRSPAAREAGLYKLLQSIREDLPPVSAALGSPASRSLTPFPFRILPFAILALVVLWIAAQLKLPAPSTLFAWHVDFGFIKQLGGVSRSIGYLLLALAGLALVARHAASALGALKVVRALERETSKREGDGAA